MTYEITPADRAAFRRCRRQWDFGAAARRDLEPLGRPAAADLGMAFREALDVYYFPGMWDWEARVTRPLVFRGLERALSRQWERCAAGPAGDGWPEQLAAGRRLLERYAEWAPAEDRFSPVLVQPEYDVHVLDSARPPHGLVTARGEAIRYRGRLDLLAVDGSDAYWIVSHRLVEGDWPVTTALVEDEEAVTACWAWEQFYLGMTIAGTLYNEVRAGGAGGLPADDNEVRAGGAGGSPVSPGPRRHAAGLRRWLPVTSGDHPQRRVRQHEPSGGGRSIPQHRRMYATAREPVRPARIEQHVAAEYRRTWVRRSRAEVAEAGRRLAADAAQMADPDVTTEPSPSAENCPGCAYLAPCQVLPAGPAAVPAVIPGYRRRPARTLAEGRLGGGAWGLGRGAAPPKFRGDS